MMPNHARRLLRLLNLPQVNLSYPATGSELRRSRRREEATKFRREFENISL